MNINTLTAPITDIRRSIWQTPKARYGMVSPHNCPEEPLTFQKMAGTQKISLVRPKNHSHHEKMARTPEKWLAPKKNRLNTKKMTLTWKKTLSPQKNDLNAQKIIFTGKKSLVPVISRLPRGDVFCGFTNFFLIHSAHIINATNGLKLDSAPKNQSPHMSNPQRGTRAAKDEPP